MKNAKSVLISLSLVLAMLVMGLPGNSVYAGETSVPGEGTEITSGEEQTEPGSGDTGTGTDQGNGETIASDTNQNGAGNTEEAVGGQGDPALTPDNAGGGTDSQTDGQTTEQESPSGGQEASGNEQKNTAGETEVPAGDKVPAGEAEKPAGTKKALAGETEDPAGALKAPAGETEDPADDADGADEGEKKEEKVTYPLWVGGVQVSSENCGNILGNGTASYNPETKTLNLVNANILGNNDHYPIHATENMSLTITGSGSIGVPNDSCYIAIYFENGGSLTLNGDFSIRAQAYAIEGNTGNTFGVTVADGTVFLVGYQTVLGCDSLTLPSNDAIREPSRASFDRRFRTIVSPTYSMGVYEAVISAKNAHRLNLRPQGETSQVQELALSKSLAAEGETVTLTGKINDDYTIGKVDPSYTASDYSTKHAEVSYDSASDTYSFTMPGSEVMVYVNIVKARKVTVNGEHGTAAADKKKYAAGDTVTLTAEPDAGYRFKEWNVVSGGVTVADNKFKIGEDDVEIQAVFEVIPVESVSLDKTSLTLVEGSTEALTATVAPEDALNKNVSWSTGDEAVAAVDENGTVTAAGEGKTTITVTTEDGKKTAACEVTVEPRIYTVTVKESENGKASADPESGKQGTEVTLTATPDTGYRLKEWQVVSGGVTVADNKFTIGEQNVEIQAVFEAIPVESVALNKTSLTLEEGGSETLTATVTPEDALNKNVSWSTSDAKIATVDGNGKVTAVKEGKATITVTTEDGKKTSSCEVTVKAKDEPAPEPVKEYKVTFDANGGAFKDKSVKKDVTVEEGKTAAKPEDPARDGYDFDGWYTDTTFKTSFDFKTAITTDTKVYAKWTEVKPAEEIAYTVAGGAGGTWTKGSKLTYLIRVRRNVDDSTCFSHFTGVQIDGRTLANGTDYTAKAGSTVVTLNAAALEKLTVGRHTVTVNFDDGSASTNLTIKDAGTAAGTGTAAGGAKTGDHSNLPLWLALLAAGIAGAAAIAVYAKRRRS